MNKVLSRVLLDDSFGRLLSDDWFWRALPRATSRIIKARLNEKTTTYSIEVPGYERESLNVVVQDGFLKVNGERDDGTTIRFEDFVGRNVITTAKLKNGLLLLTVTAEKESLQSIPIEE